MFTLTNRAFSSMRHTGVIVFSFAFFIATSIHAATIQTVPIGNSGNGADTRYDASGYGSVGFSYQIGTFEITNAQYAEFLNNVDPIGTSSLNYYIVPMTNDANGGINRDLFAANGTKYSVKPGRGNNPVNNVNYYNCLRFINWLHNGQGNGSTEDGAYTLLGGTPTPSNASSIIRNSGAKWWLPSENEWYKAAYHKNDGTTANYWDYASATDAIPYSDQPPGTGAPVPANTANYYNYDVIPNGYNDGYAVTGSPSFSSSSNYFSNVGAYVSAMGPYGTFDQTGNANEWIENGISRGGSWGSPSVFVGASSRGTLPLGSIGTDLGFRVATVIPEPSTGLLFLNGLTILLHLRRRKNACGN
jgi:formylglycine-generating enzyme